MIKECKYCGQAVIAPDDCEEEGWRYCTCAEAGMKRTAEEVELRGREAIEFICGENINESGLAPIPYPAKKALYEAMPGIIGGDIASISIKLYGDGDKITMKLAKGEISITRARNKEWRI